MRARKWICITGASTGIGRATTEYLAQKGFSIYATARKQSDLDDLNQLDYVTSIQLDVTKPQEVAAAFNFINSQGTGLDALINNAGIACAGPLMDLPEADLIEQLDVNLVGIHRVTCAFFSLLLKSQGRIIMVSSNSGFFAAPFFGPYNVSKFALEGYADTLRRELLLYGMKVIIIQPGSIHTPIWKKGETYLEDDRFQSSLFKDEARGIGEYAIKKGTTKGMNPIKVAEAIHKALTQKKPKLRYLIAPDRFRNFLLRHLPDSWIDNMIKKELQKFKADPSDQEKD
ncbi:MAG: SDR family oxidoreductase [Promethearchaeota archaeon]|nr:MAG: SDR family oxidoreductase [Candidatus Lokiarchaeota archaeon]